MKIPFLIFGALIILSFLSYAQLSQKWQSADSVEGLIAPGAAVALAYSPDGSLVAVGGKQTFRIISATDGHTLSNIPTLSYTEVRKLEWSSTSRCFATLFRYNTLNNGAVHSALMRVDTKTLSYDTCPDIPQFCRFSVLNDSTTLAACTTWGINGTWPSQFSEWYSGHNSVITNCSDLHLRDGANEYFDIEKANDDTLKVNYEGTGYRDKIWSSFSFSHYIIINMDTVNSYKFYTDIISLNSNVYYAFNSKLRSIYIFFRDTLFAFNIGQSRFEWIRSLPGCEGLSFSPSANLIVSVFSDSTLKFTRPSDGLELAVYKMPYSIRGLTVSNDATSLAMAAGEPDKRIHAYAMPEISAVESVIDDNILLKPSPVSDMLSLSATVESLQVFSLPGQLVAQTKNSSMIDLKSLSSGVYIACFQISGKSKHTYQLFVKN